MNEIIVAILAFAGTVIGSGLSIFANARLTNYKIDELKKQVERHNSLIDRTYRLEGRMDVMETKVEDIEKRGA